MLPGEPPDDLLAQGLRLAPHFVDFRRRHDAGAVIVPPIAQSATRIEVDGRVCRPDTQKLGQRLPRHDMVSTLSGGSEPRSREDDRRQLQRAGIGGREPPVERQRSHPGIAQVALGDSEEVCDLAPRGAVTAQVAGIKPALQARFRHR